MGAKVLKKDSAPRISLFPPEQNLIQMNEILNGEGHAHSNISFYNVDRNYLLFICHTERMLVC
jgi:hypothetical protein